LTYDDQIWLPVVNNWIGEKYDAVFVDEAQDLSPARRELVRMALKPGGRIFIVGDRMQAIYGWAGADVNSLPQMIEDFRCTSLPLSCSWRCAQSIVREAQSFNPIIEASATADEGVVDRIEINSLLDNIQYGDVLLSRTNAPLVRLFFQLARNQRCVKFIGRDYGKMLSTRICGWQAKHKGVFTGNVLLEYNDTWMSTQAENNQDEITERVRDEHATIVALTVDLNSPLSSTESVDEILSRCEMFSPDEKKDDGIASYITLSSTHRFKGLERDHAYLLLDTYKPGRNQEETNLMYVAQTRAKKQLTYVQGDVKQIMS
jgi:superfamily I DNA/RNA helicase